MNIEIGDTVQTINKPARLFGALKVLDIVGDDAICEYNLLDKDINVNERPTSMSPTESCFPLADLTIIQKKTD